MTCTRCCLAQCSKVADVSLYQRPAFSVGPVQPFDVLLGPQAGQIVIDNHLVSVADQAMGQIATDKAGSPCNECFQISTSQ